MLNFRFWRSPSFLSPIPGLPVTGAATPRTHSLALAPAGKIVKISGFGLLSAAQRQHLQAYGLLPGRSVQVLSQKPVTIVLVEQTELAFETEIAAQVQVEE